MADIAAREASEALAEKPLREARAAREAKDREVQASLALFRENPLWVGQQALRNGEWKKLEDLVESLAASGKRAPDGRLELHQLTSGIESSLEHMEEVTDKSMQKGLAEYQRQFPKSAFAPILPAMQLHGAAWRARGGGYSSTVTDEGWSLFAERSRQAWQKIMAVRSVSDRLPTWYEQAIKIGIDANIEDEELMNLFEEGIKRFPGYYPIHKAALRQLAPRWGGNYVDADTFIRAQVAASRNTEGEILYTLLYWQLDSHSGSDLGFFKDSSVDWSRMRSGFDALLKKYPAPSNRAVFASYACRSGDASTYLKVSKGITSTEFEEYAPQGISLEVCNARFFRKE